MLITGAASGLGRGLADEAARAGHPLILSDRPGMGLEAVATQVAADHGVQTVAIAADLANPAGTDALWQAAAAHRPLHAVIANAGLGRAGALGSENGGGWARESDLIAVNVTALTRLVGLAAQAMRAQGQGRILTIGSIASWGPGPGLAAYHASKAYVLSLTHALREELRGSGVTATALCPGPMQTAFFQSAQVGAVPLLRLHPVMTAPAVARIGWRAMTRGQAVAIPGWRNRLTVWATHLGPKPLVARIAGWLWRARG